MFILENFKDSNHELKTIGINMLFSKVVLLKSVKMPYKTVYAFKVNNKYLCYI